MRALYLEGKYDAYFRETQSIVSMHKDLLFYFKTRIGNFLLFSTTLQADNNFILLI